MSYRLTRFRSSGLCRLCLSSYIGAQFTENASSRSALNDMAPCCCVSQTSMDAACRLLSRIGEVYDTNDSGVPRGGGPSCPEPPPL